MFVLVIVAGFAVLMVIIIALWQCCCKKNKKDKYNDDSEDISLDDMSRVCLNLNSMFGYVVNEKLKLK